MINKNDIFISYSDLDNDKVGLIVKELEGNTKFNLIIIAANREALKPLAQKVADGIIQSNVIIPILTSNSYQTQWINQEIGFATALKKKIMPIVENGLGNSLKGFIHKQIDLPYSFSKNEKKAIEHKDFIHSFRNLIADLEKDFISKGMIEELPKKTRIEEALEKVQKAKIEEEKRKKRIVFLNSPEAVDAAQTEVLNMFSDIRTKIKPFEQNGFSFGNESTVYHPTFILKCEGFSFSISWSPKYDNTIEDAILYVKRWEGHVTTSRDAFQFAFDEPQLVKEENYKFNRNENNKYEWLNSRGGQGVKSDKIVDDLIAWLINEVLKKRGD